MLACCQPGVAQKSVQQVKNFTGSQWRRWTHAEAIAQCSCHKLHQQKGASAVCLHYSALNQHNKDTQEVAESIKECWAVRESKKSEDDVDLLALLKACASQSDLCEGKRLHAGILRRGLLQWSTSIGNALINLYAKCSAFGAAEQLLTEFPLRDAVSWNSLISGFCHHGQGQEALNCLQRMQDGGISPNEVTFLCILKACGSILAAGEGADVHAEIARQGLLGAGTALDNALIDMYSKCGAFSQARHVLDGLTAQNVVAWTALITGYVQRGHDDEAIKCFEQMQENGISPNAQTFASILRACGSKKVAMKGEALHCEIVRKGLFGEDTVLGNALVDMYVKCGELAKAQRVFDRLPVQNIVSWNVLIAGYCLHGYGLKALRCYEKINHSGLSCDAVTLACVLNACGSVRAVEKGREIHSSLSKVGLLEGHNVLENALVDMYAKCGTLAEAQYVFDGLSVQDLVSWTALTVGYYQQGCGAEAIRCFEQMKREGISPDAMAFACVLRACGSVGAIEKGKELHAELVSDGFSGEVTMVGSALVEMYAQCGAPMKAQEVFDELPFRDVSSWTALITGYAQAGCTDKAFGSFDRMVEEGIQPNPLTFFVLLNVCNGSGLVTEGQMYLEAMVVPSFCSNPTSEHYTCMVHLFARTGQFSKAMALMRKLPSSHHLPLWHALLSACQSLGNEKLACLAFSGRMPDI